MSVDTSGRVLQGWNPEDEASWDKAIAWRTLSITTFSMILAFAVWFLVSAIAPKLNDIGFNLTSGQLYWLAALPGLSGGAIRLIYMFLPPVLGTRKLVGITSLLLAVPMLGWGFAVTDPSTPYWWLVVLALMTGIGGGCFSGYLPSSGYFFPKRMSGSALGLQAGIGNFGMSLIQLIAPWLMGFTLLGIGFIAPQRDAANQSALWVHNVAWFFVPWAIVAAILAFTLLKDVPVKANFRQQLDIFGNKNTWILTIIYIMTFGAFSGFAAQYALLVNNVFGKSSDFVAQGYDPETLPKGAALAFLGPMIGAGVRALWGPLCDRFGGAIWTFICGVGMTVFTVVVAFLVNPTEPGQFWWFFAAMMTVFFFSGLGNAGTFKQMPMILNPRQAGGVIGWTAAIAAFGPFIVGMLLSALDPKVFFLGCAVFFAFATTLTWIYYARPNAPFPG